MSQLSKKDAIKKLWQKGVLHWKLNEGQMDLYNKVNDSDKRVITFLCSRRFGKCLAEGTEVLTPTGPTPIEKLRIGDTVYGYNKDGSVSPTKVLNVIDSGIKEVVEIKNHNRVLAESTEDHVWATKDPRLDFFKELKLKDIPKHYSIIQERVIIPGGDVSEPHAYVIGALAGDGCSRQGIYQVHISSEDDQVPKKCAEILGMEYCKQNAKNYTWCIKSKVPYSKKDAVFVNYYNEWLKDRYAHEKIIDLNTIKTWNRESRLNLLAGLIDTDGTVCINGKILTIGFTSQSKSLMDAFQYLVFSLAQYKPTVGVDKRDKYKNGPCYYSFLRSNKYSKLLLKELSPYLAKTKKQYKPEYDNLNENNTSKNTIGIKQGSKRKVQCWDITVANETSLYLLANGLVTHNSFSLTLIAVEQCLKKPNSIVKFLCPTQKMVKTILIPIMRTITEDCPKSIQPDHLVNDGVYRFKNGSEIQFAGSDNGRAENLRGGRAELCIVDEAGFCDDLGYTVRSILLPTVSTTGGKIILSSTPPRSPGHEFADFVRQAQFEGTLIKKTIYDNKLFSPAQVYEMIQSYGGENNPEFQREFLCEMSIDAESAVFPEFTEAVERDIVKEVQRPPHFDYYVCADIGFKDFTAILFGYLDFLNNRFVIEDEIMMNKSTTEEIANAIKQKERELLFNPLVNEQKAPYLRVSDNNLFIINDFHKLHGLVFMPTQKDNRESAINQARITIGSKRVVIHPRCKNLILHLKNAVWNKSRTEFDRSPDHGHYDMAAAFYYLIRNIQWSKNPYPANYQQTGDSFYVNKQKEINSGIQGFNKLIKIKKSL